MNSDTLSGKGNLYKFYIFMKKVNRPMWLTVEWGETWVPRFCGTEVPIVKPQGKERPS